MAAWEHVGGRGQVPIVSGGVPVSSLPEGSESWAGTIAMSPWTLEAAVYTCSDLSQGVWNAEVGGCPCLLSDYMDISHVLRTWPFWLKGS